MSDKLNEGALVTLAIDELVKAFSAISTFSDVVMPYRPDRDGTLQRSNNNWFKPLDQLSPTVDGWDVSASETDVLELSIGGSLGDPANTYFGLRADDVRDETSYRRKIRANARQLMEQMERRGLQRAWTHGSLLLSNSNAFGSANFGSWDAMQEANDLMFDRQLSMMEGTCAFLNSRDYSRAGGELVSHDSFPSSIEGEAYRQGRITKQVAGFDEVYKHNQLPRSGAQATSITINGAQTFDPLATETSPSGQRVPFDHRFATITVNEATTAINVGDKFTVAGLKALSEIGNVAQDGDRVFTVVGKGTNTLTISPRPIALDDATLTDTQKPYANCSTSFADADALVWQNTTDKVVNIFMPKDAMVIASSEIPMTLDMFAGMKVEAFSVGPIEGIIGWQGNLGTARFTCRIAIWYEWQVERPEAVGAILPEQA
jgi:hypothetical protein